jgi:hypothetical protein
MRCIGMNPKRWEIISSCMQDVFADMVTESIANVGVSPIITRRSAFATLGSVSESTNFMVSSPIESTSTLGRRAGPLIVG